MTLSKFLPLVLSLFVALPALSQSASPQSASLVAATAATAVPALVSYSGVAVAVDGKPLAGEMGATFLIYKDETGGEPLFAETQTVAVDAAGRFQAQLGATHPSGLPLDLFASGEARWLEVQLAGQPQRPRMLLASVPYALKAADAATLGGLPASAFALAGSKAATAGIAENAITGISPDVSSNVTTTGGTVGNVPMFTGASTIGNSILFQNSAGTGIGVGINPSFTAALDVNGKAIVRGVFNLSRTADATPATGTNSYPFIFNTMSYDSARGYTISPVFAWQAESVGNNTAAPSATMNLLYNSGLEPNAVETGLSFNPDGTIHFAAGQTFPGTGAGTITGVAAGSGLTGGGTSGAVTLNLDTSKVPLLNSANTFAGNQAVTGNISATGSVTTQGPGSFDTSGTANVGLSGTGVVNGVQAQASGTAMYDAGMHGIENAPTGQVYGVLGETASTGNSAAGVVGFENSLTASQVFGVLGHTKSTGFQAAGVLGDEGATTGQVYGVAGQTSSTGTGAAGVAGLENATSGLVYGVSGSSNSATDGASGINAFQSSASGNTRGLTATVSSTGGYAVYGNPSATSGFTVGVFGDNHSTGGVGVIGKAQASGGIGGLFINTAGSGLILQGQSGSSFEQKFYVDSSGNGFFAGNLTVNGTVSKGGGSFKIDDPLDPANKYLSHSFVESPDMMNVYNGNVKTDKSGRAMVELPEYFDALNSDFRYQLTVIGQFAQAIVAKKISGNRFVIRTSKPSVEVSWQVTGIRKDAYANANRIPVEEAKPEQERGYYLHPEVYGQPASKGIVAAHRSGAPANEVARLAGPANR